MKTDDTLISYKKFSDFKQSILAKAKFKAKFKTCLSANNYINFNGCKIQFQNDVIKLVQKG